MSGAAAAALKAAGAVDLAKMGEVDDAWASRRGWRRQAAMRRYRFSAATRPLRFLLDLLLSSADGWPVWVYSLHSFLR